MNQIVKEVLISKWVGSSLGVEIYDCQAAGSTYGVVDLVETGECQNSTKRFMPLVLQKVRVLISEPGRNIKGQQCRVIVSKIVSMCRGLDRNIYRMMFTVWRKPIIVS